MAARPLGKAAAAASDAADAARRCADDQDVGGSRRREPPSNLHELISRREQIGDEQPFRAELADIKDSTKMQLQKSRA